jgi:Alpha-L-arabinofuranosidase
MSETSTHRTSLRIDDVGTATTISPDLWGIFFEDINSAADGGLCAELVRNRSFSFTDLDSWGWNGLTGWETEGDATLADGQAAMHLNGREDPAIAVNSGFDGIPVRAGERYRLVIDGLGDSTAEVEIELRSSAGALLASATLRLTSDPERHRALLHSRGSDDLARLVVTVKHGAVDLTLVSLFPDATSPRPDVLRSDLVDAIADLRPRFVRFPGGCVAHGLGLPNLYRWKDTVGPIEDRKQNFNLWGYHQSMGLGYFEYFTLCEGIGAKPLPVLAAGVCCQNTPGGQQAVPLEQFDDYVRDVLDLIEYANGDASTPWGSVRAEAGHPEPFALQYLAIGNEDEVSEAFEDRFARLLAAVKQTHPEITVIGTVGPFPFGEDYEKGWELARRLEVRIVDEHSYKSPSWYFKNLDRFDDYDRSGPGVYVGEYGSKGNTMLCALAEAAYMMGMERNGDIVRLASYAPLLAKVDRTQWVPDLIYFDNTRVMPTLNYHVQRMHSAASGDESLRVVAEGAPGFRREHAVGSGLGIRARNGRLRISDARLDDSDAVDVMVDGDEDDEVMLPLQTTFEDYTITLRAHRVEGESGFVIAFGALTEPDGRFEWHLGTWENRFLQLLYRSDGLLDDLIEPVPYHFEPGRIYELGIHVEGRGRRIRCLIDDVVVHDVVCSLRPEQRFTATAVRDSTTGILFVKAVNATDHAVMAHLDFASGRAWREVWLTTLCAPPHSGAAFETAPAAPSTTVSASLEDGVSLPPYSFVTMRLADAPDAEG